MHTAGAEHTGVRDAHTHCTAKNVETCEDTLALVALLPQDTPGGGDTRRVWSVFFVSQFHSRWPGEEINSMCASLII